MVPDYIVSHIAGECFGSSPINIKGEFWVCYLPGKVRMAEGLPSELSTTNKCQQLMNYMDSNDDYMTVIQWERRKCGTSALS